MNASSSIMALPKAIFYHTNETCEGSPMIKGCIDAVTIIFCGMIVLTNVMVGVPLTHQQLLHLLAECLAGFG